MVDFLPVAFGFANAAVLGWLAAAAAPILIHLWMKRARRETPWAAVRFLQAAIKRHARRLRLQEWLLLAIRTAIIVLVVLAASKPLVDNLAGLVGAGARTHRVLVIDASLSMRFRADGDSGASSLQNAKRLAAEVVDASGPSDLFSLCVMAEPPRMLIGPPTVDRQAVKKSVAGVEATEGPADMLAVLRLLSATLEANRGAADRAEVVLLSDLTDATWRPLASDPTGGGPSPAAESIAALAETAGVTVIDVGVDRAANAAATTLKIDSGVPTLSEAVRFVGGVQRFGPTGDEETLKAELLVDGVSVASREVPAGQGETVSIDFTHRFRRPGWRRVAIRLPRDGLEADNTRRLSVEVRPYLPVLCVEGRRGDARYIASALNPTGDARAPLRATVVSDSALPSTDLEAFDTVFLCNVPEFTPDEAARIGRYVRGGGGLAVFLGDRVRAARYNESLGRQRATRDAGDGLSAERRPPVSPFRLVAAETSEPLLPVMIGEPTSQATYGVDPLRYEHPIVAPFRGRERAGLLTTPVERYFALRIAKAAPRARAVLATAGGDPLMVASPVGAGRVVVVATAGSLASVDPATSRPWTAMPAWPSFVPIVREIVNYTAAASINRPSLPVGSTIDRRLRSSGAAAPGQTAFVRRPDGDAEPTPITPERGWAYQRTDRSGFYALAPTEEASGGPPLDLAAVNPNTAESDLTRVAIDRLPRGLSVRRVAGSDESARIDLPPPTGLHRTLLLAALGLVLVETALAARFGRGAA